MTNEVKYGVEKAKQKTIQDCTGFSAPVCTSAICDTHTVNLLENAVYISIRNGVIVGTPFGPEVPDGRYVWIAELPSARKEQEL